LKSREKDLESMDINGELPVRKGNFYWKIDDQLISSTDFVNGEMHLAKGITDEATVEWVDEETGRWIMSYMPKVTNKRYKNNGIWFPEDVEGFTHCGDPFQFLQESKIRDSKRKDKSRLSKGALACFIERDMSIDTATRDISTWETNRFALSHTHRHRTTEEFGEDAIMQMVFFGGLMFPEINVKNLWKYIVDRGFEGYLLYMTDERGKYKATPGFNSLSESKQALFQGINTYVTNHIKRELHIDIIRDIIAIKGLEDMTNRDLFTAAAGCLYGSRSRQRDYMKKSKDTVDVTNWFQEFEF
jgi:hypothetical protein